MTKQRHHEQFVLFQPHWLHFPKRTKKKQSTVNLEGCEGEVSICYEINFI